MRITMYMPGLSARSLGWPGHSDFAKAMAKSGHPFEIVATDARGDLEWDQGPIRLAVPQWSRRVGRAATPVLRTMDVIPSAVALAIHLRRHGPSIEMLHAEMAYPVGAAVALAIRWSGWRGHLAVTPMGEDVLTVRDAAYGFRRHLVPRVLIGWTLNQATCRVPRRYGWRC